MTPTQEEMEIPVKGYQLRETNVKIDGISLQVLALSTKLDQVMEKIVNGQDPLMTKDQVKAHIEEAIISAKKDIKISNLQVILGLSLSTASSLTALLLQFLPSILKGK